LSEQSIYTVRNWDTQYENNRSRSYVHLSWVPLPNTLDGDGYTALMERKNGAALYGAWVALVLVASKCNPRGRLMRSNGLPHDSVSLARMTRMPESVMRECIEAASSQEIGWLQIEGPAGNCQIPAAPCPIPAGDCPEKKEEKEQKEMNRTEGTPDNPAQASKSFSSAKEYLEDGGTDAAIAELQANPAYAHINVRIEAGKMFAWCKSKRLKPTKSRLTNWLNRIEKPLEPTQAQRNPAEFFSK
jgi:hypothetical protein